MAEEFLAEMEKKRETMFKPSDQPVLAAASRGDIAEMKEILRMVTPQKPKQILVFVRCYFSKDIEDISYLLVYLCS